jgi:FixJ family two-component response regulator
MERDPKVFVVDDDPGMRKSTCRLVESAGMLCQPYESAADFLQDYSADQLGCLVLDMSMPGMSGIDLIERLRAVGAQIPIIVVSGTGNIPLAVKGMKLGVIDFLEKPVDPEILLSRIRTAFEQDVKQRELASARETQRKRFSTLTIREFEVVKCLVRGLSNKQVAAELNIAIKTVDNHRTRAMAKTGALNAADLARLSTESGIL